MTDPNRADLTPELEAAGRAIAERMYKGQRTLDGKPMAWDVLDAPGRRAVLVFAQAALDAVAPLIAAQALEDARDAGAAELLKLLIAEDDAQYVGGSSLGMGPIEACETAEGWLDARAAKLRGTAK